VTRRIFYPIAQRLAFDTLGAQKHRRLGSGTEPSRRFETAD
jgi:hypothetical protein